MPRAHGRTAIAVAGALSVLVVCPLWAGEIRLRVTPAESNGSVGQVRAVRAVDREGETTYPLAQVPAEEEGQALFTKSELPLGQYDLVLLTHRGRIEGVDLKGEGVASDAPTLREKDVKEIRRLVLVMTSFADRRRILFLKGRGSEARVLVEEVSTRKTTLPSSVPFLVWRVEVWHYRKEYGAWDRCDWEPVVRQRPGVADFENTTWVFEPALGGLTLDEETPVVEVTYRVPESFDPSTGVVAAADGRKGGGRKMGQ